MDLISVIVPVYNVEDYLEKCLESIKEQSYKNIEIILIDDGSTDLSSNICDNFAKNDNRFIVIHSNNNGVSAARNIGIKVSKGKYLVFVDSDDWIEKDYVSKLHNVIDNCDFALCNFNIFNREKITSELIIKKNILSEDLKNLKYSIFSPKYGRSHGFSNSRCVCGKMFKSSIIKDKKIYFDEKLYLLEDGLFNLEYLKNCKNFYLLTDCLYNYRQLITSSSHRYNENQLDQYEMVEKSFLNFIYDDLEKDLFNVISLQHLITYIVRNVRFKNNKKNNIRIMKEMRERRYKEVIKETKYKYLSIFEKGFLFLLKFRFYNTLYFLLNLKEKIKSK